MTPAERLSALAASKRESEAFRADYDACKESLAAEGWTREAFEELAEILKVDLADGPGVERPFPMTLDERRACWRGWFREKIAKNPVAGINARMRDSIATEEKACQVKK